MAVVCLRICFHEREDVTLVFKLASVVVRESIEALIASGKTSLGALHRALYYPFFCQHSSEFHSNAVILRESPWMGVYAIAHSAQRRR